ncbi:pyridoxamine 5'-phosphate oxidase family protein [Actinocorallia longicatena]|uniref:Pyridoxamine 5'-phosphate oxidase family protein n=1 Tax=Actinocorallia longicatena TaxID=111803 RepID=A0ABP6PZX3_9ACTN
MLSTTERTTQRKSNRALTGREDLYAVLDAGMICHLGVIHDASGDAFPMVVPTGYGRIGDTLYLHGSSAARSLRAGGEGQICVTVTHLDGVVLARSAFHHSLNYRSAMIYGTPRLVTDEAERMEGLRALTENLAPGQWDTVRKPNRKEMAATIVLALSLEEASVKVRTGPPEDDAADHALPVWAGVLPVRQVFDAPVTDPALRHDLPVPDHITHRI